MFRRLVVNRLIVYRLTFPFEKGYAMRYLKIKRSLLVTATLMFFATVAISGCQRKEKVLDIEGPNGELEIERDVDTGAVDVEIEQK